MLPLGDGGLYDDVQPFTGLL